MAAHSPIPVVLGDGLAYGPDPITTMDSGTSNHGDRRKRTRRRVSWRVFLWRRNDTRPVESRTQNISSEGFYCVVTEPFLVGEVIRGNIVVANSDIGAISDIVVLQCRARVVRVEEYGDGFGVGCHIEEYNITRECDVPAV